MRITDTQLTPVNAQGRRDIKLSPGDVVRVHQKIVERGKTRIQVFEGVIIACKHGVEPGATFTVRRVGSDGIAVEKIFPLYSPMIEKVEVIRRTKTRRSRLYFLRDKTQKQVREKLRRTAIVSEFSHEETEKPSEDLQKSVTDASASESEEQDADTQETVQEPAAEEQVPSEAVSEQKNTDTVSQEEASVSPEEKKSAE